MLSVEGTTKTRGHFPLPSFSAIMDYLPPPLDYLSTLPGVWARGEPIRCRSRGDKSRPSMFGPWPCFSRRWLSLRPVWNRVTTTALGSARDRPAKGYIQESAASYFSAFREFRQGLFNFYRLLELHYRWWRMITLDQTTNLKVVYL